MGYYSSYEAIRGFTEESVAMLNTISGYDFDCDDSFLAYDVKWYDYKNDLKELSAKFPDTLFEVERIGEESPDIERIYAKNGKVLSLKPQIIWPEFKEEDLK